MLLSIEAALINLSMALKKFREIQFISSKTLSLFNSV